MFASDYPHWDFDAPSEVGIPKDWQQDIFHNNANNALDTYKKITLPEKTLA